jgi:peptidoglycan/LPS O-acetylase OafA/YrhL
LLVLFGHARGLLFVSIQDVPAPGVGTKAFYFLTGVHREAVAIFFAVSGFLVGGAVWRSIRDGRFEARSYLTSRFVRIYLVFLPALALTLLLDAAGRHFLLETRFYGVRPLMPIGVTSGWTWSQMACHLAAFQGIGCMPLGANIPLWSLGFEWVFYLLAPLLFGLCLWRAHGLVRAGGLAILFLGLAHFAGGFATWTPWLSIWIAGAAAAELARRSDVPLAAALVGLAVVAAGLVIARLQLAAPVATDLLVGFGTAIAISNRRLLAFCPFERLVWGGADCSYSLYLTHLPVAVFLGAVLERFGWPSALVQPGPSAYLAFAGLVATVLAAAFLFAQGTERHTEAVRALLLSRPRRPAPATLP